MQLYIFAIRISVVNYVEKIFLIAKSSKKAIRKIE